MRVSGESNCKWVESYGSGKTKKPTEFTGREIYLDFSIDLISPQANSDNYDFWCLSFYKYFLKGQLLKVIFLLI